MEPADLQGAVRVWQAASTARGKPPSPKRVARVIEKLQEPTAMPYVASDSADIVGIALFEPCREDDGQGAIVPAALHISMVFVDPDSQGQGIGSRLMRYGLDAARDVGVLRVSLWTGRENASARRLYEKLEMKPTRTRRVEHAVEWIKYEIAL